MTDDDRAPSPDATPGSPSPAEPATIGYGRPPTHTRWQKGQSGNLRGRPKGQRNLKTDLTLELGETIRVMEGGKPVRMTKQRAFVKALVTRAIKGDARASTALLSMAIKLLDQEDASEPVALPAEDQAILEAFLARHGRKGEGQ